MSHEWRRPFTNRLVLLLAAVVALVAAILPSLGARAAAGAFATIDVPNSTNTYVMANNASGDIVGYFTDANKVFHGFLLRSGAFTTLDFPGADVAWTQVNVINDAGDMAGTYSLKSPAPAGNVHGFLRTKAGEWTTQDYPEGTHIMAGGAYGILADGTVVGCYHDGAPAPAMYGYAKGSGGATSFNYPPNAPYAMHYGVTPDGKTLVGGYLLGKNQPDNWHGYVFDSGNVVSFDVPGKAGTQAMGISSGRDIVGVYKVLAGTTWAAHGFVADTRGSLDPAGWSFALVDVPGAAQTIVRSLNARDEMVGYYIDAGGAVHGFQASAAAAATPVTDPRPAAPVNANPAPLPPSTGTGLVEDGGSAASRLLVAALVSTGLAGLAFAALTIRLRRKTGVVPS